MQEVQEILIFTAQYFVTECGNARLRQGGRFYFSNVSWSILIVRVK